ncbi:ribonuclease P protein component [Gelidibacter salicanalis]|uniref:Ribonuclease P protein component n=1 Tax=Gelidibacter salicanalis TaxID=291193 RepID=A0A934KRV6_9FLAO|nr:ribonuclease P protein component [Gelidibacter salicanalis]MBJ7879642.1 ribonuclease P protein component [Gelidibacter salicanalis]
MEQSYKKIEKLKSEKLIEKLFAEGKSVVAYPLRLVYLKTSFDDAAIVKAGVSVSKRNFKKAVQRNRLKRLMREAYRLNKSAYFNNITEQYAFMILYTGKSDSDFKTVSKKMNTLMDAFLKKESQPKP